MRVYFYWYYFLRIVWDSNPIPGRKNLYISSADPTHSAQVFGVDSKNLQKC